MSGSAASVGYLILSVFLGGVALGVVAMVAQQRLVAEECPGRRHDGLVGHPERRKSAVEQHAQADGVRLDASQLRRELDEACAAPGAAARGARRLTGFGGSRTHYRPRNRGQ